MKTNVKKEEDAMKTNQTSKRGHAGTGLSRQTFMGVLLGTCLCFAGRSEAVVYYLSDNFDLTAAENPGDTGADFGVPINTGVSDPLQIRQTGEATPFSWIEDTTRPAPLIDAEIHAAFGNNRLEFFNTGTTAASPNVPGNFGLSFLMRPRGIAPAELNVSIRAGTTFRASAGDPSYVSDAGVILRFGGATAGNGPTYTTLDVFVDGAYDGGANPVGNNFITGRTISSGNSGADDLVSINVSGNVVSLFLNNTQLDISGTLVDSTLDLDLNTIYSGATIAASGVNNHIWFFGTGADGGQTYVDNFVVVPEPTSLSLLALGGAWLLRRKRHWAC